MIHRADSSTRERGAVAVEFVLVIPLLVAVIFAGVYLGRVVILRHRLTDAINLATRNAAVEGDFDEGRVAELVEDRLGGTSGCSGIAVTTTTDVDADTGLSYLTASLQCTLDLDTYLGPFESIGFEEIVVTAAAPLGLSQ